MNLKKLEDGKNVVVTKVNQYNHECRLHGIKKGVRIKVIHQYKNKVVLRVTHYEVVIIPKIMAVNIEVEEEL